ncbi:MAG: hypothetical protein SNJ29_08115 [Rikenellaceae bacterium]
MIAPQHLRYKSRSPKMSRLWRSYFMVLTRSCYSEPKGVRVALSVKKRQRRWHTLPTLSLFVMLIFASVVIVVVALIQL